MEDLLLKLGIPSAKMLMAAVFGSMINIILGHKMPFWKSVVVWISGIVCSVYLTPIATEKIKWLEDAEGFTGFMLGILGMRIILAVIKIGESLANDPLKTVGDIYNVFKNKNRES